MFYLLKDIREFAILTPNWKVGQVDDFYLDDHEWNIRYLVVDADPRVSESRIFLSTAVTGEPVPGSKQIPVSLTREQLKESHEIDLQSLHSFQEVTGYSIQARDGEVGQADDFLIDETWAIRYLIVDTAGWLPGRKVLFAPAWVTAIHKDRAELEVDLSQETIINSPEYDPESYMDRSYERDLHDHYGRPGYWD